MRKRIAIIATYIGVMNRGAETFVIELAKQLRRKYDVDIYALGSVDELKDNIIKVNFSEKDLPYGHTILTKLFSWYSRYYDFQYYFTKKVYNDFLLKKKYDLVFVNNGSMGCKYAKKLRKYKGTPYIVTAHGGKEYRLARECPNRYIAISSETEQWMKTKWPNVETTRIFNGVDCKKFTPLNNSRKEKPFLVLSVGALIEGKRHKLTIDAVSNLDNCKLLILGKGDQEAQLKKYGEEKLKDRFELKSVPYEEIVDYYHKASVFVLPSKEEPFGIVYLEAMASNIPVVVPDDSVRREVVGDGGIFCNCEDEMEYARSIQAAIDKNWADLPLKQAYKFDWREVAIEYEKVIEELTDQKI